MMLVIGSDFQSQEDRPTSGTKQSWHILKTIQDMFEEQVEDMGSRGVGEGAECLIREEEGKQDGVGAGFPLGHRSQYEKLPDTHEEGSSDDDLGAKEARKKLQKHHGHQRTKPSTIIQNLRAQRVGKKNKQRKARYAAKEVEDEGQKSDDSIGSASDLRDAEDGSASEAESVGKPSVYTCGSSAYHAECESMTASTTHETRRRKRVARGGAGGRLLVQEEGEESAAGQRHDAPLLESDDSWDTPWDDEGQDVFAMAPFQRPEKKPKPGDLVTFSPEKPRRDLLTFSESDSQQEERPPPKSPNLIILSESDSDLKKTEDPRLLGKDAAVTETLHLVRERLRPLELAEPDPEPEAGPDPCPLPPFQEDNPNNSLFSDDDEAFPTKLAGFSPAKDMFGFSPFHVNSHVPNPFEGDDFHPENEVYQYFTAEGDPEDDKLLSPDGFDEAAFHKHMAEKETRVHFSLGDKILHFKSDKKIYYDALKHEEKLKKKLEEKNSRTGEKCKKHKGGEGGFSNMSFEDCASGEDWADGGGREGEGLDTKLKKGRSLKRRSNPFT